MTQHVVRTGESIYSIAKKYAVDPEDLRKSNNISDPRKLYEGQVLTIPHQRKRNADPDSKNPKQNRFPPKASPKEQDRTDGENAEKTHWILFSWLEELLEKLRSKEAEENVQKKEKANSGKEKNDGKMPNDSSKKKGSRGSQHIDEVKEKIKDALNKEPHVVTFSGVKLTLNERMQIVAAVACCEMSADGFGSVNADSEFVGRHFGKRGIETSYSRIVHIGLSYGIIQFTQDSGSLGTLLKKMYEKNSDKFVRVFGNGNKGIAQGLLTLTSTGPSALQGDNSVPLSGQAYWNKIRKTESGKEIKSLSMKDENKDGRSDLPLNKEIRGKRVQPIPANPGEAATDIWEGTWRQRFLDAGNEVDFQEAQLECAVEMYMNPILPLAKTYKVRSATALAFICACSVRGGPTSELMQLLFKVAKEKEVHLPFDSSDDELRCIEAIAEGNGKVGKLTFDKDESRRAKLLLKDQMGFLAEDLYDLSTY